MELQELFVVEREVNRTSVEGKAAFVSCTHKQKDKTPTIDKAARLLANSYISL